MLTVKQNLLETIHGGNPDRFVNQYEFLKIIYGSPFFDLHNGPVLEPGVINAKNAWGITFSWPEGLPGEFPVHDEEHLVLKDVTQWRDHVHAPALDYTCLLYTSSLIISAGGKSRRIPRPWKCRCASMKMMWIRRYSSRNAGRRKNNVAADHNGCLLYTSKRPGSIRRIRRRCASSKKSMSKRVP